jgi:hypothetical protein
MQVVECGPEGVGWEIKNPKEWIKRWGPAIIMTITILKVALITGKCLGIPLPSIPENIIDSNFIQANRAITKIAQGLLDQQILDGVCYELAKVLRDDISNENNRKDYINQMIPNLVTDDAYHAIRTFLTTGENAHLGSIDSQLYNKMKRIKMNGSLEWVSLEGEKQWDQIQQKKQTLDSNSNLNMVKLIVDIVILFSLYVRIGLCVFRLYLHRLITTLQLYLKIILMEVQKMKWMH